MQPFHHEQDVTEGQYLRNAFIDPTGNLHDIEAVWA